MMRDIEMRRILVRLYKKQKKRPPPIQFSKDRNRIPAGVVLREYRPSTRAENV